MSALTGRKCVRDPQHNGQRTLGAAEGVLVTLRRCSLEEAFAEIVQTAKLRNVAPIELANALVAIAEHNETCDIAPDALAAAQQTWSALVEDRTSIGGRSFSPALPPTADHARYRLIEPIPGADEADFLEQQLTIAEDDEHRGTDFLRQNWTE